MITPERLTEYRHIAPTAGPEGQRAIDELLDEMDRLRGILEYAHEEMLDMRSYVPEYFSVKWGHDEAIAKVRAALDGAENHAESGPEVVDLVAAMNATLRAVKDRREAAERARLRGHDA